MVRNMKTVRIGILFLQTHAFGLAGLANNYAMIPIGGDSFRSYSELQREQKRDAMDSINTLRDNADET
jgi:hypothetical protein